MPIDDRGALYVRNTIFGIEDSLVSTVGLLTGIASVGQNRETIVLTGIVLIFVEAFSMAVGSLLSEQSVEDYEHRHRRNLHSSYVAGAIMFGSYFLAGFIPTLPYAFLDHTAAIWVSIGLSVGSLAVLGYVSGRVLGARPWRRLVEMTVLGGLAILVGVAAGRLTGLFSPLV